MEISALVTDLDGTFWSTDMGLHKHTLEAVEQLDSHGVPLIVATGRRAKTTAWGLEPHGLGSRPAILMNGALVRDRLDGPSFFVADIPAERATRVREVFESHGLEPLVYIDHPERDVLAGPGRAVGDEFIRTAPAVSFVEDLGDAMEGESVTGFGAFGFPSELLDRIKADIEADGLASAIISPSHFEGDLGIMVQGAGIDKATGLDAYCDRHHLDRGRLAVVGDGFNDVGMLESAAIAIVPTNAPEAVQAIAHVLIEPNELGGWAQIPEILGL